MKTALVCGAGGFIGSHLVKRLKKEGYYVVGADLKFPEFSKTEADDFYKQDLRSQLLVRQLFDLCKFDEVYQLAADMGGAGFIFTGEHDADIMHNSAQINLNIADACVKYRVKQLFYSSSACVYPMELQNDPSFTCALEEHNAYPANPDSRYGWEKLFSEQLYTAYRENYRLNVKIARFHNVFGEEGTYKGGREKSIAAICRKIAEAEDGDTIEVWGDGEQTRSFLYIDECIEGIRRMMDKTSLPVLNLGSNEQVSINQMVAMVAKIAGKQIFIKHIKGPEGVRGRNSENSLIKELLEWAPSQPLEAGLFFTYRWIDAMVKEAKSWQID